MTDKHQRSYMVVQATGLFRHQEQTLLELELRVSEFMEKGWDIAGGLTVDSDATTKTFYQPIIKK